MIHPMFGEVREVLGDTITYSTGAAAVRKAVHNKDCYLLFMPPALLVNWPDLSDLGEFTVLLDKGEDTLFFASAEAWAVLHDSLPTNYPFAGVVFLPDETPPGALERIAGVPVTKDQDLMVARDQTDTAAQRVPITRLLLEAIDAVDPVAALGIAIDAEKVR